MSRDLMRFHGVEWAYNVFVRGGLSMLRQFPTDYRKELVRRRGGRRRRRSGCPGGGQHLVRSEGAHCSAVLVEAGQSKTGGPMLARNLDYPSLGYVHEYTLVTVYKPNDKHAFAAVGFPGLLGCLSGMNDAGLTVAVLEVVHQGGRETLRRRGRSVRPQPPSPP